MPWVVTNGKNYITRDKAGKNKTTGRLAEATRWQDRKTVDNFCQCMPRTFKNLCYYPTFVQDEAEPAQAAPPQESAPAQPAAGAVLDESLLDEEAFIAQIEHFQTFVARVQEQRPLLMEAQRHAEAEIRDIEHAAEFYQYNAAEGYQIFRRLKDARVRRRRYKDAIAWIDMFLESNPKPVAEARTVQRIRGMEHRQYRPLALPELFEKERAQSRTGA